MSEYAFSVSVRTQIHLGTDRMLPEIRPLAHVVLGVGVLCAAAAVVLPLVWGPPALKRPTAGRSKAIAAETVGGAA